MASLIQVFSVKFCKYASMDSISRLISTPVLNLEASLDGPIRKFFSNSGDRNSYSYDRDLMQFFLLFIINKI